VAPQVKQTPGEGSLAKGEWGSMGMRETAKIRETRKTPEKARKRVEVMEEI